MSSVNRPVNPVGGRYYQLGLAVYIASIFSNNKACRTDPRDMFRAVECILIRDFDRKISKKRA